ncbi:MAG TPA: hypothetical protein DHV18_11520 [Brochothrix thermosphacta]|nr:hypothetical protein [Brochothrix thermosphacta]
MSFPTIIWVVMPLFVFILIKLLTRKKRMNFPYAYVMLAVTLSAIFFILNDLALNQWFLYLLLLCLIIGFIYVLIFNAIKKEIYIIKILKGYTKILLIVVIFSYFFTVIMWVLSFFM